MANRYDAFISYRHGELDGLVAERLHKLLEAYVIPRPIAKKIGRRKLTRIFRDREELPTSSNLSDSINEALENSDFLLLICSRRTCGSQWVMREVERFGELRGKDNIITLLIDGEPDESFPPGLREREVGGETIFVEPLAADIRAETRAGSIKLLKEEKLRLLAPILGCAFDDLRRRHRRRRVRRIATLVGAAFAFTQAFGSFATYQYIRIEREMQMKLRNQSYVLAEYSGRELGDGDPDTAMLLALEALPRDLDDPERPLVPAAERALADALGVYDAADGFKPHRSVPLPAAPGEVLLSPGERYAAALYPYALEAYDTESAGAVAKLPLVRSALSDAEFLSDTVVVYTGEDGLAAYDLEKGEELWRGRPATILAVSGDKSVIAAVYKDESSAALYSSDGRELGEIGFGGKAMLLPADDSFVNPHDTLLELSGGGDMLAVSFDDGSLSVFDAETRAETRIYPPSEAIHFSGGFCRGALAFSVVEDEPYYSGFIICDPRTGDDIARYESEQAHFIVLTGEDGLFVAFEEQIMRIDELTGDASYAASAGGRIETFQKNADTFLICESGGPYRFAGTGGVRVYQSDYACRFADIGENYALTGGYDSKTVRILKKMDYAGDTVMTYDADYRFSEAKINAAADRAVFYSYSGMRLCDLSGNVIAEADFPEPPAVTDTQYDEKSGNVIVIYDDRLLIYSGNDGSILLDKRGIPGVKSVLYTPFGAGVLDESETATLYDLSDGNAAEIIPFRDLETKPKDARCALPIGGGVLTSEIDGVYFDGVRLGEGEIAGADAIGDGAYAFAISDGGGGAVFTARNGAAEKRFDFESAGDVEVYFAGDCVFVSPKHGDAAAYTADGALVRTFGEVGFLAETRALGEYVAAGYVVSSSERYTLLLDAVTLDTAAYLPGLLGVLDSETLVLDAGGSLRAARLRGVRELMEMAESRLGGRQLTPEERREFNVN